MSKCIPFSATLVKLSRDNLAILTRKLHLKKIEIVHIIYNTNFKYGMASLKNQHIQMHENIFNANQNKITRTFLLGSVCLFVKNQTVLLIRLLELI